jgi:hypothetical protein
MLQRISRPRIRAALPALVILAIGLVFATQGYGQVAGATLAGTVKDASGAYIPNAQISIISVATGVTRTVSTDTAGFYNAPNLLPGLYNVTVSAAGFATETQSALTLTVGAKQGLNFTMQVGEISQKVEVTGEALAVELTSSALSDVVNATTVRELPLNGRDWTSLATLQPGVASLGALQPSLAGNTSVIARGLRGFGTQLTISGGRPGQNNYRMDGISVNDYANSSPGSALGSSAGVDAIAEFSVLTSNYSAEYGRTSGGVVNSISRSGTNQFHGNLYEFLRNSALDARNFFDGPQIPPFRRNQFGGSAGGPIRKGRTFVFGDYEEVRQSLGITNPDTVPSLDTRNGILHNLDGTPKPAITVDPLVKPFLVLWPLPPSNATLVGNGDTAKFLFAGQQDTAEYFVTARVDHKLSTTDSLAGSFQWDKARSVLPDGLDNLLVQEFSTRRFVAIEWSHTFSSQLINSARFGFNRSTGGGGSLSAINPAAADHSLSAVPGWDAPSIGVTGLTGFNGGLSNVNSVAFAWNSFQGYDDAFLTKGIHSLKFGVAVERMQENFVQHSRVGGAFSFGSLLNFLTNKPTSFQAVIPSGIAPRYLRQTLFGVYVQDDVRWRPNLTLNLGLRYEMTTAPIETKGKLSALLTPTDSAPHLGNPYFSNPTLRNFEPRVGFAWDPFGNGKTSVRAGFGLFDVLPLAYEYSNTSNNSFPFSLEGRSTSTPQGSFPSLAFANLAVLTSSRVSYIEPKPHRNYTMQWNLNIQREIVPNLTATVAFVGSRGVHQLFRADDMNMIMPVNTPAGYLWPASGPFLNTSFGRIDFSAWGSNSFYDALEFQIQKKMSHGLQIGGSYTWGKSIDEGSGSYLGDPFANSLSNPFWFDRGLNRAVADFNVSQNLVINYTWIIGTPKSLRGAAAMALGGWQLGGIFQVRTGLPFTPRMGGDPLGSKDTSPIDFPNRLRGAGCESAINPGNPDNYIKLNCFAAPNPLTLLGNSGRNSMIGPGLVNVDLSIFKNNYVRRISENFNVQFRTEIFNLANRANFSSPTDHQTLFDQNGVAVNGAGLIDGTSTTARQIQFALKVIW